MITRSIKLFTVLLVMLLVTACAPEFRTPVAWGGGKKIVPGGIYKDPMRVALYDAGVGHVTNLPRGVAEKNPDGYTCTRLTSGERYTGDISWRVLNEYVIEVEFGDSKYPISDGPGKFDSQSWDLIEFEECGEGAGYWQLGVSCGFVGEQFKNHDAECPARD